MLFVGKILQRFLYEKDGAVESLQLDCLKPAFGSTSTLEEIPNHLQRDVGVFAAHNIISGPLEANFQNGGKWQFPDYMKVQKTFQLVSKLERKGEFSRIYSV